MKKRLIIIAGVLVGGILVLIAGKDFINYRYTKSFSPEDEVRFNHDDLKVKVNYNRPYKKGRLIFGGLVPYDTVWRTGANEATTFETNEPLTIEGKKLPAGKYTLWTIPRPETWTVIFNSEYGQWGINSKGQANRDPHRDVLAVDVHAVQQDKQFEQFTITFDEVGNDAEMILIWDKTLVTVPFSF